MYIVCLCPSASAADPRFSAEKCSVRRISQGVSLESGFARQTEVARAFGPDAGNRILDRQLVHVGLLDDAAPIFGDGERIVGIGAVPPVQYLMHSGLLRIARSYGGIGRSYFTLYPRPSRHALRARR